jgi:hypothetical protein
MTYAPGHRSEARFAPGAARTRWQRSESPAATRQQRRRSQRRYLSSSAAHSCTFAAEVGLASDSAAYAHLAHHLPRCFVDDAHALLPGAWAHPDLAEAAAVGQVAEVRTGLSTEVREEGADRTAPPSDDETAAVSPCSIFSYRGLPLTCFLGASTIWEGLFIIRERHSPLVRHPCRTVPQVVQKCPFQAGAAGTQGAGERQMKGRTPEDTGALPESP